MNPHPHPHYNQLSTYKSKYKVCDISQRNSRCININDWEVCIKLDKQSQRDIEYIAVKEGLPIDTIYRSAIRKYIAGYRRKADI